MKEDVLFKRTPFGGFDRVEVISYIQRLKATQQEYKLMLDEKAQATTVLSRENDDLTAQAEALRAANDESEKKLKSLEDELAQLKAEIEFLKKSGTDEQYATETVEMCDELVETANQTADKLVKKAEKKLSKAQKAVDKAVAEIEGKEKITAKQARELLKKLQEELSNGRV